jgi:hypoxanthine phosphoribosyltransferase
MPKIQILCKYSYTNIMQIFIYSYINIHKLYANIHRIINNNILKIVNIVFSGGGGAVTPGPPLCTALLYGPIQYHSMPSDFVIYSQI